jgi:glycosyltransferase involved in cell wall biosynthesis
VNAIAESRSTHVSATDTEHQTLRVAVAHDWFVRHAGSERVVEEILRAFPGSDVLTTIVDREAVPGSLAAARPSFLQAVPGAAKHHEWLLPAMPLAWRLRKPVRETDAVISSSHACAKGVRVVPGIPHLCYCHTPMRYAWDFDAEAARFPVALRTAARASMPLFRHWDRGTARRVTCFLANSRAVAERIARCYGRSAQVVHPPVRTDFFTPGEVRGDAFLYVGRLVSYKRPDLVVDAFGDLPYRLLVVGEGGMRRELEARATANVSFLGEVSDRELRFLYRTARALLHIGEEDFGIAMAEAQACGTPVVASAQGGARDIVEHGRTGWLVPEQRVALLRAAIRRAATHQLDHEAVRASALRFTPARFRHQIREAVVEMVESARRDGRPR